ncbi:MAG: hypothetical protein QI223_01340, partial [Candidatus Korarchaeota archaeon]|nr:hypothetical protein [Candidatus Korarchaeota archaeon]
MGRDYARVGSEVLRSLKIDSGSYVKLVGPKSIQIIRVFPEDNSTGKFIRLPSFRAELLGLNYGDDVEVIPIRKKRFPLKVRYSYQRDIGKLLCRVHPDLMKDLGIKSGDYIEIVNSTFYPERSGRLIVKAFPTSSQEPIDEIRLDSTLRNLLRVNIDELVVVSAPPLPSWKPEGLLSSLMGRLIGFRRVPLVVLRTDYVEPEEVVRCHSETLKALGVREGERVCIQWLDRRRKVKALKIKEGSP